MATSREFVTRTAFVAVVLASACASRSPRQGETTMPNPDGCFVQVWDAPRFEGITDYINGPRTYTNLRDLPGGRLWNDRIRSTKVGPGAQAAAYTDEKFQGRLFPLQRDAEHKDLPAYVSGQIESLRIDCTSQAE